MSISPEVAPTELDLEQQPNESGSFWFSRDRPLVHPWRLLGILTGAGIVIEALLHGQPPALGFSLAALVTVLVVIAVASLRQIRLGMSVWVLLGSVLFFGGMVGVRASNDLKFFNIVAVLLLLLLIAYLYRESGWLLSVGSLLGGLVVGIFASLFMPFSFFFSDLSSQRLNFSRQSAFVRVLLGIGIALPLLAIFTALFASADAVFAGAVSGLWRWDIENLIVRLIFIGMIVWLAVGLMRFALIHDISPDRVDRELRREQSVLGAVEGITVLVLVNGLFLAFVGIQFAYLFGGLDTLAQTGLTFSEYARRGFFELVAVAVLVVVLVLGMDWLAKPGVANPAVGRGAMWVDGLHGLLLLLTAIVLVSALQRMRLYVEAFGLTQLRFYTTATMLWIGFALLWTGFTVLRGKRLSFVPGVLLAAILVLAGVNVINPDATIARYNLTAETTESGLDVNFLSYQLSDDAVPTLLTYRSTLSESDQLLLIEALYDRLLSSESGQNWRGMDWGTVKARALAGK